MTSTAPLLQVPENQSSFHSTSHLFKKQWLRLNPTFPEGEVLTNVYSHGNPDEAIDDDNASLLDDNLFQMD
jgi:hypothetical protein